VELLRNWQSTQTKRNCYRETETSFVLSSVLSSISNNLQRRCFVCKWVVKYIAKNDIIMEADAAADRNRLWRPARQTSSTLPFHLFPS